MAMLGRRAVVTGLAAAAGAAALARPARAQTGAAAYRGATELVRALAAREVSSRELVDAAIARIELLDPKVNAVVVRDWARARAAPAHFCGVLSHKPSIDLIPQRGSGPPETPARPVIGDMAVIGPMARSAADLQLALDVLAGPDERWGGLGYKLDLPAPRHERLADFRVLVLDTHPLCATAANVKAAVGTVAGRLETLGCTVLRQSPQMPNLALTTRVYVELLAAALSADARPEQRLRTEAAASALPPENLGLTAAWLRGATMSHAAWVKTSWIREGLRARWNALLDEVDVILCPPMPTAAFPHDHGADWAARRLDVDGTRIPYVNQVAWAAIATTNGLPSTTVPVGRTELRLPLGVQVIGGYLQDRMTIAFAGLLEREFGGFAVPPGF